MPLQCEALSHRGVGQLLETVEDVRQFANEKLRVLGVIATMFDSRTTHSRQVLAEVGSATGCRSSSRPYPSRSGSPKRPASVGRSCNTRRRPRGRGLSLARHDDLRRHAERLTWPRPLGDKSPDPLGKRALFWVPSRRETGSGCVGVGHDRGVAGGQARAVLGARPGPDSLVDTSGNPLADRGSVTVVCEGCDQTSRSACSTS